MKYRGTIEITKEFIHQILGIPDEVEILGMHYHFDKETLKIFLYSDKEIEGATYKVEEGMMIPHVDKRNRYGVAIKRDRTPL